MEQIFDLVLNKDDISWQTIIYDLIRSGEIDPWNIDVTLLTKKYITTIKKLKELDFNVSGKVVLAAALLLKIKSSRLVTDDINALDSLFAQSQERDDIEGFDDMDEMEMLAKQRPEVDAKELKLIPRTPQARRRKVTIYDLMDALQKAMEVKKRRVLRKVPEDINIRIPKRKIDITQVIRDIFGSIKLHFHKNAKSSLKFSHLVPEDASKEDKVYTFIPLLHLSNARKIDLHQPEHFGEIDVFMAGLGPKVDYDPEEQSALKPRKKKKAAEKKPTKKKKK